MALNLYNQRFVLLDSNGEPYKLRKQQITQMVMRYRKKNTETEFTETFDFNIDETNNCVWVRMPLQENLEWFLVIQVGPLRTIETPLQTTFFSPNLGIVSTYAVPCPIETLQGHSPYLNAQDHYWYQYRDDLGAYECTYIKGETTITTDHPIVDVIELGNMSATTSNIVAQLSANTFSAIQSNTTQINNLKGKRVTTNITINGEERTATEDDNATINLGSIDIPNGIDNLHFVDTHLYETDKDGKLLPYGSVVNETTRETFSLSSPNQYFKQDYTSADWFYICSLNGNCTINVKLRVYNNIFGGVIYVERNAYSYKAVTTSQDLKNRIKIYQKGLSAYLVIQGQMYVSMGGEFEVSNGNVLAIGTKVTDYNFDPKKLVELDVFMTSYTESADYITIDGNTYNTNFEELNTFNYNLNASGTTNFVFDDEATAPFVLNFYAMHDNTIISVKDNTNEWVATSDTLNEGDLAILTWVDKDNFSWSYSTKREYEVTSNKVTAITETNKTSKTLYPSVGAMVNWVSEHSSNNSITSDTISAIEKTDNGFEFTNRNGGTEYIFQSSNEEYPLGESIHNWITYNNGFEWSIDKDKNITYFAVNDGVGTDKVYLPLCKEVILNGTPHKIDLLNGSIDLGSTPFGNVNSVSVNGKAKVFSDADGNIALSGLTEGIKLNNTNFSGTSLTDLGIFYIKDNNGTNIPFTYADGKHIINASAFTEVDEFWNAVIDIDKVTDFSKEIKVRFNGKRSSASPYGTINDYYKILVRGGANTNNIKVNFDADWKGTTSLYNTKVYIYNETRSDFQLRCKWNGHGLNGSYTNFDAVKENAISYYTLTASDLLGNTFVANKVHSDNPTFEKAFGGAELIDKSLKLTNLIGETTSIDLSGIGGSNVSYDNNKGKLTIDDNTYQLVSNIKYKNWDGYLFPDSNGTINLQELKVKINGTEHTFNSIDANKRVADLGTIGGGSNVSYDNATKKLTIDGSAYQMAKSVKVNGKETNFNANGVADLGNFFGGGITSNTISSIEHTETKATEGMGHTHKLALSPNSHGSGMHNIMNSEVYSNGTNKYNRIKFFGDNELNITYQESATTDGTKVARLDALGSKIVTEGNGTTLNKLDTNFGSVDFTTFVKGVKANQTITAKMIDGQVADLGEIYWNGTFVSHSGSFDIKLEISANTIIEVVADDSIRSFKLCSHNNVMIGSYSYVPIKPIYVNGKIQIVNEDKRTMVYFNANKWRLKVLKGCVWVNGIGDDGSSSVLFDKDVYGSYTIGKGSTLPHEDYSVAIGNRWSANGQYGFVWEGSKTPNWTKIANNDIVYINYWLDNQVLKLIPPNTPMVDDLKKTIKVDNNTDVDRTISFVMPSGSYNYDCNIGKDWDLGTFVIKARTTRTFNFKWVYENNSNCFWTMV